MVVLHMFPRGLHYKTLVDLPFSKTSDADLDCESIIQLFCFDLLLTLPFFFVSVIMGKFDYQSIKKA